MEVKTFRIPKDLDEAMEYISSREKIEKAQSLRKLAHLGFEAYMAKLYGEGRISLREGAQILKKSLSETMVLFREYGIGGNIGASEVLESLETSFR